jgi:hypothetical protein
LLGAWAVTVLDRLRNDRFGSEHTCSYSRGWNASSHHIERLIHQWINEARVGVALDELVEAPVMDLRLRDALVQGGGK